MAASLLEGFPVDAIAAITDIVRSFGLEKQWEEFIAGPAAEFNAANLANAEQLGPIKPTTTLAANQFQSAKNTAAGLSNQATTDVNRRFDQTGAAGQASLASRGLGGSTLGSSVAFANERNRSDELRRVNDDRIKTLLGVEETFGAREIAANEFAVQEKQNALDSTLIFPPGSQVSSTRSSVPRN